MELELRIVSAISVLVGLVLFAIVLRHRGVLDESHGKLFSRLITQVTLPALVFFSISRTQILLSEAELAAVMFGATVVCLALGWIVATMLSLEGMRKGPVILVSGFGSSSLLGIALVTQVFPDNDAAVGEAVVLSALGVQPLLFTIGTMVAQYYGETDATTTSAQRLKRALTYFRSPIFIAFVAGLLMSIYVGQPTHPFYHSVMDGIHVVASANTLLVTFAIGLLIQFQWHRDLLIVILLVACVKLLAMPLLVWMLSSFMDLPTWQIQVLLLEAAMPSATLAVVFASSYGCDASFASKLVLATTLLAIATVPIVFNTLT